MAQVERYTIEGLLRLNRELAERARQLQTALDTRVVIEQAKGILAARHDLDIETAFDLLRHAARSNRMRLHELATRVVEDPDTPPEISARLGALR